MDDGALNLDIESQGEADERRWGVCLIALIPGQGEHLNIRRCGSSEWGNSIHKWLYGSWAFTHYASTQVVWAMWVTHRLAGDRLHIPWVLPIASSLRRTMTLCKDKSKQSQALPLKEDFRQCARLGNSRVSRLHEEEGSIPQCQLLISKAMQVLKRTEQLRVPGNSQTESVSHS